MNSEPWRQPYALIIVATAVSAALYAVGSLTTAYIPSPWGMGQFRPAVVIPSFFAVVFGPWAGGLGFSRAWAVKRGCLSCKIGV